MEKKFLVNLNKFIYHFFEKQKKNSYINKWIDFNNQEKIKEILEIKKEVQKHGFIIEKFFIENIYKCKEKINYTSIYDLPGCFNYIDNGVNVSIKTTNNMNTVCLGDVCRFYKSINNDNPIHMIVIYYEQLKTIKKIKSIYQIDLTNSLELLFNNLTYKELENYDRIIKNIPKNIKLSSDQKNFYYKNKQQELNMLSDLIYLNPKVDSKSQRRLQCSFNKFSLFLKKYPEKIIYKTDSNIYKNIEIPNIKSVKRVFK
jgi:tetratricopeptide (TPR) repeat protein